MAYTIGQYYVLYSSIKDTPNIVLVGPFLVFQHGGFMVDCESVDQLIDAIAA